MGWTDFPHGVTSFGAPVMPGLPALPIAPGANVFFVDSSDARARNSNAAGAADRPFASLHFASSRCTANNGDTIFVQPAHVESVVAAGGLTLAVAGVTIVFLCYGNDRGRIQFGTLVGADMNVNAADITMVNPRFVAGLDALAAPIDVNAARFRLLNPQFVDGTAINTTRWLDADANADNMTIEDAEFVDGNAAGTQKQSLMRIAAATGIKIKGVRCTGNFATGIIENSTAWVDALLENLALDNANVGPVVCIALQATSSGWVRNSALRVASGAVGYTANNDMQFDDVAVTGTDGAAAGGALLQVPAADATTNVTTNEVVGNKADAAQTTVAATRSTIAYIKGLLNQIGALVNTGGVASLGGMLGDPANTSIVSRLATINNNLARAGAFGWGATDAGMAASQTVIVSALLSGLGNDFPNNRFYMQVLVAGGAAPEGETRLITDYVSATGTFTTNAFSVNVEANDIVLILHESAVMVGSDNADNIADTTNVVANENGSLVERQEQLLEAVNRGTGTSLPANTSLPDFVGKGTGTILPANTSLHDELAGANGIAVMPAAAAPANGVSLAQMIRDIWDALRNGTGGAEPGTNRSLVDDVRDSPAPGINHPRHIVVTADFTQAVWNTVATHEVFTITGAVRMRMWILVTGNVGSAGAGATISFGHASNTAAYIAPTDEDELDNGDLWYDATPTTAEEAFSTAQLDRAVASGLDIGYQIAVEALTGGTIEFHCVWDPIGTGGSVAAGTGAAL